MKLFYVRVAALFGLAGLVNAACASTARTFSEGTGGDGGTGMQTGTSSTGTGEPPSMGGGGAAGQSATGTGGTGGESGMGGNGGALGGTGGGGEAQCVWIDVTADDCSSGIMIGDFCPDGRQVTQLERCTDASLFTPDVGYQMYRLSGCPDVCTVASDHVVWRRIECCM